MTREEWLRHAVEEIDAIIFGGDLDLLNHGFQIACGRCPGKRKTECIQPSDGEDITLDDFFPTTISVDFKIKDIREMLINLTYECIHAFFNEKSCSKRFKKLAEKYYFEKPYKEVHASPYLEDLITDVHRKLIKNCGEFPGKPIVFPKKEKKEGKKNVLTLFCPECGFETKVSKKVFDSYNQGLPTCMCGTKMAVDMGDESEK